MVRVNPVELKRLAQAAKRQGTSIPDYMRQMALKGMNQ